MKKVLSPSELSDADSIHSLRKRALKLIFLVLIFPGAMAIVPTIFFAYTRDLWQLIILSYAVYTTITLSIAYLMKRFGGRTRIEKAMRESETEKAAILDCLLEHVVYQDMEMRVVWANRAACESVALTREEIIGRRCYEIWAGRESRCEDCPVHKAKRSGQAESKELTTPDGRSWLVQGSPVSLEDDKLHGVVEVTLDISELKQAENELRIHRDHLEDMVEKRTSELKTAYDDIQREIDQRKKIDKELENYRLHLEEIVWDRTQLLVQAKEKMEQELFERERAEIALRQSERRLKLALEAANDGLWDWNVPTGKAYFSPRYYTMLGYLPNEFEATYEKWASLLHPDDKEKIEACVQEHVETKSESFEIEFRIRAKSGEYLWLQSKGKVVEYNENGAPIRMVGTHIDITKRKQTEAELEDRLEFETLASELSATFVNMPSSEVDNEIEKSLQRIVEFLNIDRANFFQVSDDSHARLTHSWAAPGFEPNILFDADIEFPNFAAFVRKGETLSVSRIDDIPEDAEIDRRNLIKLGVKSVLAVPLQAGESYVGALSLDSMQKVRDWPDELIRRVRIIGEVLANAILRKRNVERVLESQERFKSISESAKDAIVMIDPDGKISFWNGAAERIFGYSQEEAINQNLHYLIAPGRYHRDYRKAFTKFQTTGEGAELGKTIEMMALRKDNTEIPIELSLSSMRLQNQWHAVSIIRDITERKRSEKAQSMLLNLSEAANTVDSLEQFLEIAYQGLSTLVDASDFYVALYDETKDIYTFPIWLDKYEPGPKAPQVLHKSLTDFVRRSGVPLLVDDDMFAMLQEKGEVMQFGHPAKIWLGVPLKTPYGTKGVIVLQSYTDSTKLTSSDLDLLSSVAGPIAMIIERKHNEEHERLLQEKLEKAERMESLGVLAGGVAHDLNNMLGPLVGYPELIMAKLPKQSPVRRHVQRIADAAKDAAEVIQDLLTLARRGRYEMQPTDINRVLESYLDSPSFVKLSEERPEIEVDLNLDKKIPAISGSAPHLSKVFMNLIVNAFDAMSEGGWLKIETSWEHLDELISGQTEIREGDYLLVRIKDSGVGIAPEDMKKIFEPYYSSKEMGKSGSGLGLSVVYGIIKDHKGYYDIFSKVGEGTEFVLYFPTIKERICDIDRTEIKFGNGESVLIIDDSADQREMALEILGSLNYRVAAVSSGRDAIRFLKTESVDLVILDMIMENGCDGLDTYRAILKLQPGQKALIVSGYTPTERVSEMQKLGAGKYIKKPYSRDNIAIAIREELDKQPVKA